MKRRRRHIIVLGLSSLLCALSVAGWVRSQWVADDVAYGFNAPNLGGLAVRTWGVGHGGGDVGAVTWEDTLELRGKRGWRYQRLRPGPLRNMMPDRVVGMGGYGICRASVPGASRYVAIVLPYWLITLPPSVPLLVWAWGQWRGRAARRNARLDRIRPTRPNVGVA